MNWIKHKKNQMACTNREKETDWDIFFLEKKSEKIKNYHPPKKIKKIKKMPCYQGTGLGCPVVLLAGFPSKYTGLRGELEHLTIETRLIDESFECVMGECVIQKL